MLKLPSVVIDNNDYHLNDLNKAIESLDDTMFRGSLQEREDASDFDESSNTVSKARSRHDHDLSQELPSNANNFGGAQRVKIEKINSEGSAKKPLENFSFSQVEDHQFLSHQVKLSSSSDRKNPGDVGESGGNFGGLNSGSGNAVQNSNSNDVLKMSINDSFVQLAEDTKRLERKRQHMSQSTKAP